jgi:hypothetical protein
MEARRTVVGEQERSTKKSLGEPKMNSDPDHILPEMIRSLWKLTNTPPATTGGKVGAQRRAFRLLLEIRGGVEFVITRPKEELEELVRRGIWQGQIILQELASLELQWRRGLLQMADLDHRRRQILTSLFLKAPGITP